MGDQLPSALNIGYLISQYPAVNHTFILREVQYLRRHGFELHTASIRDSDRPLAALSSDEAEEYRRTFSIVGAGALHAVVVNLRAAVRRPLAYLRGLGYAWRLTRGTPRLVARYTLYFVEAVVAGSYFERRGVRHVHTHFSSTVLLLLSRMFPVTYSMTLHGPMEFDDVVGFHIAEKVAGALFVATISHYASSQVMKASDPSHWHKVTTLRLGVDPTAFAARHPPPRTVNAPFRLVFVGRLAPAKAQFMLIEAVAILRDRGRRIALTLVGEGPARPRLVALVKERDLDAEVKLVGACNHDRVAAFYRDSDAFVLGSFAEGVPVVLMEAMAMEVPCIATWIAGVPELIENGVDGLLVAPADPLALAEAIVRLIDDPELARRLGAAARRKVVTKYNLEINTERLGDEFRRRVVASPAH
jgi:glycosyltransferase involved in cell wall biosynthesis